MIRLAIRVPREHAELVLAELLELAPSGIEEVQAGPDHLEYAVYGPPGELPDLPDLYAAAGDAQIEVSTTELPDDWSERWKRFHKPVSIVAPRTTSSRHPAQTGELADLHIRPPWEPSSAGGHVKEIVIDPAQAFGTGAHATTRLCLELLLELAAAEGAEGPVLDVGTGSGVLAIAAAKLGYAPVLAVDYDPQSIDAARTNAAANGVQIQTMRLDLRTEPLPNLVDGSAGQGVVLANLLAPLLEDLARSIQSSPEHLIASGLLTTELDQAVGLFCAQLALVERQRRIRGDWASVWLSSRA